MPAVDSLVTHKHVTLGAPGVRSVTLLQYHDCVPRMAVHKVKPGVGPILSPTQAPLYRAPDPHQMFWERDPVILVLLRGGWGGPSLVPLNHYVLDLKVYQHQPRRNLNYILRSLYPTLMYLPKGWPCPRNPPLTHFHRNLINNGDMVLEMGEGGISMWWVNSMWIW